MIFEIISIVLIVVLTTALIVFYVKYQEAIDKLVSTDKIHTKDITTNKTTIENKDKVLNEKIKNNESKINDLTNFSNVNVNSVKNYIINNKEKIISDIENMDGKDLADLKICIDEIISSYNTTNLILSKQDDKYRQTMLTYKTDKYFENKNEYI